MAPTTARVVYWSARLVGMATCLFIGMFALDAFSEGKPLRDALADFVVHLIPAAVLLLIVAVAWRRPWVGAGAFLGFGVLYAATMSRGRLDWIVAISGPLFVVGGLFLWSWHCQRAVQHRA
jgi:hypothetical protein